MKYWKQGFYEESIEGSIEITDEYWQELLDKQSEGLEIVEDEKGYPIIINHKWTLDELKLKMIEMIQLYDKSDEINSFKLGNDYIWLDKDTRDSIENMLLKRKKNGDMSASVWYKSKEYRMPITDILNMLDKVCIYASDCYNVTQKHIQNVLNIGTEQEIESYDYTSGYPTKLKFDYEESIL